MGLVEEKELFFKNNNIDLLIEILGKLDNNNIKIGDYCGFGAEFVLNCIKDFIEDRYDNARKHYFNLINEWDSFLFFIPSDFRGLIFDFGHIREGKILAYNGLTTKFTHDVIKEFTLDDFLIDYGIKKLYSCSHYRVNWPSLGFCWNN